MNCMFLSFFHIDELGLSKKKINRINKQDDWLSILWEIYKKKGERMWKWLRIKITLVPQNIELILDSQAQYQVQNRVIGKMKWSYTYPFDQPSYQF